MSSGCGDFILPSGADVTASENGWSPAKARPDQCVWVTVPGTTVSLQLLQGQPMAIMRAFAADFNAYVEPLRDADTAGWTPTNSVATSNHLNGTAMDLNWNSHPFRVLNAGFTSGQINTIRDMLAFYEDTIWWGNDWNEPRDAMHFQMGYDSFGNPHTADFMARKIRADGYSTFRRGGSAVTPPAAQATVLARATGLDSDRAEQIMPQVFDGLAASGCTTVNRIAMWLAQIGHESDNFNATEEYADGDESTDRWRYKGRTWIQITWKANYAGFSQWCFDQGLVPTRTYFVDNPTSLADQRWAGLGPAWYWTVARPQINGLCDSGDLPAVTRAINGGTNGLADRQDRYDRALAVGDQLLVLVTTTPTQEGDFLMALTDAEQREMLDLMRQQSGYRRVSRSPLRHVGEGPTETATGFELNVDGSVHVLLVNLLARLGDPDALALLDEVANLDPAQHPDRVHDRQLAKAIRADIAGHATAESAPPSGQTPGVIPTPIAVPPAPVAVPPAPPATPPAVPPTGGGITSEVSAATTDLAALRATLAELTQQIRS